MTAPSDDAPARPEPPSAAVAERYRAVRAATEALAAPLSAEDQQVQSMPDASPVKWHLAHTAWFFETFLLVPRLEGYEPFDPAFGYMFNSYYEAAGERHPRAARGLLTRPGVSEVLAWRRHVDQAMERLMPRLDAEGWALVTLGLAHEEQHQELILMDVLHLFSCSPLKPAYAADAPFPAPETGPRRFTAFDGGVAEVGHDGRGFSFDNERPRHEVLLAPYRLADRLVTNGEWLAFMADGGYRRAEFWLADGWVAVKADGWDSPAYWQNRGGQWLVLTLRGLTPVDPDAPVAHVSYYEADAFASWAGKRLPTEAEWEHASVSRPEMFDRLWQWTASAYLPHPGFRPGAGAVGEYNGKFMVGQMVLKGGAFATPPGHARASYRNFFYPHQRWMFSGVRLAEDGQTRKAAPGARSAIEADVVAGLSRSRKTLPAKLFYDEEGSRLFEEITALAEYYPTRTEIALLRDAAPEIAACISDGAVLVEFGSGASVKTRLVLDAAPQTAVYVPIDISPDALATAAASINADYPALTVAPLAEDFTRAIELPPEAKGRPRTGFFPGSTIGNFTHDDAVEFLAGARRLLGPGAQFVVGVDLVKDEEALVAAYDDDLGVTAAFNKNVLARINRELGADFDLAAFRHRALWNPDEKRIEMHLVSGKAQTVRVAGRVFRFTAGESIHTENSHKFTPEGFARLAARGGWRTLRRWTSPAPAFAVFLLAAD